ncbi:MAG: inositol monophosphatase [Chlorobi bacterium]|nr:inositol monophosphatase [Chlorobiota bacterium]
MNIENICNRVVDIARETGRFIKESGVKGELSIEEKGHNDFVTKIDKQSEQRIVAALKEVIPGAGFIVEENSETGRSDDYNWIVDPIDGTTNFIHGVAPYAVSIALIYRNEIILGVVYEAGLDECFYAWKGGGAWLNEKQISVSKATSVEDSLIATGFPYSNYKYLDRFMDSLYYFMQHSHGLRRLGSAATDLAYVACGRFEAFYEYGLKPWDVAAGIIIIKEAGGKVSDFKGGEDFLFGGEIIAAGGNVFNDMKDVIYRIMVEKNGSENK